MYFGGKKPMARKGIPHPFKIALFLITILSTLSALSQTPATMQDNYYLKNVIPPSPDAAALGKYAEWPVNLNTGVPNINIPLYELKGRTLSVPISLSYHASGIKVGEVASWAGLGWTLNAGGAITRSVRGLTDECGGYFYTRRLFPNYNYTFEQLPTPSTTWKGTVINEAINEMDGVEDVYFFNALGRSFKMIFKDSTAYTTPIVQTIPYSNVTVTTDLSTWKVTLEDGTLLIFGGQATEMTTTQRKKTSGCATFPSTWYLQSITSSIGEQVRFVYKISPSVKMMTYYSQDDMTGWSSGGSPLNSTSVNPTVDIQTLNILHLDSIISEIGAVKFVQTATQRLDLPLSSSLAGMRAYSRFSNTDTTLVDKFTFFTHQAACANGNELQSPVLQPPPDYQHWRLVLDSVQHNGVGKLTNFPCWKFAYNPTALPSTFSYAQDHYGYYNGATGNTSLLPKVYVTNPYTLSNTNGFFPPLHDWGNNRTPNGTYLQAMVLTGITYPTKGTSLFTYEPNSFVQNQDQQVDSTKSLSLYMTYGMSPFANSSTVKFTTTKPQNIGLIISSSISQSILNDYGHGVLKCIAKVTGPGMVQGQSISLLNNDMKYFDLPNPGTYSFTISTNSVASDFATASDQITISGTLYYTGSLGVQQTSVLAGGLRVHSIIDSDGINPAKNIQRYFIYNSPMTLNVIDPSNDYVTQISEQASTSTNYKYFRNSSTKFALGSGGSTVVYGSVVTQYGANGENGKIQTVFLNHYDVNNSGLEPNIAPYADLDTREYERGLVLSEVKYDASGNKVEGTFNTYSFKPITTLTFFKATKQVFFTSPGLCNDPQGFCNYLIIRETLTSDQVMKTSSTHTSYYLRGTNPSVYDSLNSTTAYIFGNSLNTNPTATRLTDSKGQVTFKQTLGAIDSLLILKSLKFNNAKLTHAAEKNMANMGKINMISEPILTIDSIASKPSVLTLTTYKPLTVFSPVPKNSSKLTVYVPDSIKSMNNYFIGNVLDKRASFRKYDRYGNLLQQAKSSGQLSAYLYDYYSNYPIAQVANADTASSFAYTSFESYSQGGWLFGDIPITDITKSVTGQRSLPLSASLQATVALYASRKYTVSFWARAALSVSGSSGSTVTLNLSSQAYAGVNGFKYYEYSIANTTSVLITVPTGTTTPVYVDEVRLFPQGSLMTTYTYKPLIGQTSVTDPTNTTQYFEYDGLGRLAVVRDRNRKVLKTYKYNYKTAP